MAVVSRILSNYLLHFDTKLLKIMYFIIAKVLFLDLFNFMFHTARIDYENHACRKYFHGQFLLYKAMSYRAPLPKPLSFYVFLLQVHIFCTTELCDLRLLTFGIKVSNW